MLYRAGGTKAEGPDLVRHNPISCLSSARGRVCRRQETHHDPYPCHRLLRSLGRTGIRSANALSG